MQHQLICQAVTDLLDEKKIVPIDALKGKTFDELSEYRDFVISKLNLPEEVFDFILEESKTRILSCCGNEYYFSTHVENDSNEPQICQECNELLVNQYYWDEKVPTLYVPASGIKVIVNDENFCIGRKPECHLCLDNIDMSRRHCAIRLIDNRYKVVDLGSRNGTYLNQVKVTEAYIKSGDVLRFGKKLYIVVGSTSKTSSVRIAIDESTMSKYGESSLTDMLVGVKIDKYLIKDNLGKGGMGVVYLAEHLESRKNFAIKILRSSKQDEEGVSQRFHKERHVLEKLKSPYIIQYYEAGAYNGLEYIVLEYFGSGSLGDYLREYQKLSVYLSLKVISKVLDAMEVAHESGVIHRDLKPDNILIDKSFDVRVTDFGLMKNLETSRTGVSTVTGITLGTPSYMAPEQIKTAKAVTAQTDVYGAGATLYHMLTGHPPYEGTGAIEIIMKVGILPIKPISEYDPEIPKELCAIVEKALSFELEDRYTSVLQFKDLLRPFLK